MRAGVRGEGGVRAAKAFVVQACAERRRILHAWAGVRGEAKDPSCMGRRAHRGEGTSFLRRAREVIVRGELEKAGLMKRKKKLRQGLIGKVEIKGEKKKDDFKKCCKKRL